MIAPTTLVIEHCEQQLSEWLLLEYTHAASLWPGKTIFSNVHLSDDACRLRSRASVVEASAVDFLAGQRCIILDPKATEPLVPSDFKTLDALIIGGILGFKNPRGRTKELLSDRSSFETRHIGPIQLTIDGAAFVAKAVALGLPLKDIDIAYEVEVKHDDAHSTILPFGYPVIDGTPVITPGLIEYLTREDV